MDSLIRLIEKYRLADNNGQETVIPGVTFYRYHHPVKQTVSIEEPFCSLILQGKKQVFIDGQRLEMEAGSINLSVVDMPIKVSILDADMTKPYYGLVLRLNLDEMGKMVSQYRLNPVKLGNFSRMIQTPVTAQLKEAFIRLLSLFDSPEAIPVLAPLIRQEIYYWLLQLPQSAILHQVLRNNSHQHQIRKATNFLRQHFTQALSIKALADHVQMSQSNFHLYFRRVIGITPLQFQKQLRLQKARQLMLLGQDVSGAAFDVGYESVSQFIREYRRHFGQSPRRDTA